MRKTPVRLKPGDVFNELTIVRHERTDSRHRRYFLCRCSCGVEKVIHGSGVISGNTKSCGCLVKVSAERRRKPENGSEITAIILGYRRHAKSRGFCWRLSRKLVESILRRPCYYCGSPPSNTKTTKNSVDGGFNYSGIDRIDSRYGYSPKNIVPACKLCNYAKSAMTVDEFREWAKRIGSHCNNW